MVIIRGAVCAENTAEDISERSVELIQEILQRNGLRKSEIQAIIFTATDDLDACYPAAAVRNALDMTATAFICAQEMKVKNSLDHCIRACVFAEGISQKECIHCYLGKAASLRPDLTV